jgi:FkbM family methyltransferase
MKWIYTVYAILFARPFWYRVNKTIHYLSLRGLGILNVQNDRLSGKRFFLKRLLRHRTDGIIIDAGANIGDYTACVRAISSSIVIHAIEPMPLSYQSLEERFAHDKGVITHHLAAGAHEGTATMYDYGERSDSTHATMYREVIADIHKSANIRELQVKVTTLDDFCEHNHIEKITLLKIDTEGNEYGILQGAQKMIAENKIEVIHFEFNSMNIISKVFMKDFMQLLDNYRFYRLLPHGMLPIGKYNIPYNTKYLHTRILLRYVRI